MYGRKIGDHILDFEASGSLYHSALVMQDDQTGSFWAIMESEAIGGELEGRVLEELPIYEKTTWGDWHARYPETLVLSVGGKTHIDRDPYANYFTSDKTFRPVTDPDTRLGLKDSIFTFRFDAKPFAVSHEEIAGGWQGKAGEEKIFVFREIDASIYQSTRAFLLKHAGQEVEITRRKGQWVHREWGKLDPHSGTFADRKIQLEPIAGIDTFWYIWSQYHPDGDLLTRE